jgi:hypothetical protein
VNRFGTKDAIDAHWGEAASLPPTLGISRNGWTVALAPFGLEDVHHDGDPVFPRVFFTVRSTEWSNPAVVLAWGEAEGDTIPLSGTVAGFPISVRGELELRRDQLRIRFVARAEAEVALGRIGPCLLHPLTRSGARAVLDDGRVETFPESIDGSPFMSGTRRMSIDAHGKAFSIDLDGGSWESEDQRNWADGTYKSYTPPLSEPQPILLAAGEEREWTVTVRATESAVQPTEAVDRGGADIRVVWDDARMPMPKLGLTHQGGPLSPDSVARLSRLGLDFVHVLVDLDDEGWEARFRADLSAARDLSVAAVATVSCPPDAHSLLARVAELGAPNLDTVLLFDAGSAKTSPELAASAGSILTGSGLVLGAGSRGHFASINRSAGAPQAAELVSLPLAAAAHDDDRRALMNSLSSYSDVVTQTRALTSGRPLFVGPVGFLPTFDPWASATDPDAARWMWSRGHARQRSVFAAAWHLAALARLASLDLGRVCLAGTVGSRGVGDVDERGGFMPYPLFAMLEAAARFRGVAVNSGFDGERIAGLRGDGRSLVAVASDDIRASALGGVALQPDGTWAPFDNARVPTPTVILADG